MSVRLLGMKTCGVVQVLEIQINLLQLALRAHSDLRKAIVAL